MDIQSALDQAKALINQGKKKQARNILREIAKRDPKNEEMYLLFAQVAEKREHTIYCLEQVLKLNPDNKIAQQQLVALQTAPKPKPERQITPKVAGKFTSIKSQEDQVSGKWKGLTRGLIAILGILIILVVILVARDVISNFLNRSQSENVVITPTNTPKPKVSCQEEEVTNYLDDLDLILEEWEDTVTRAMSTSRISLSPVIGELQDIRRSTRRMVRPECANYLNDIIIVAMDTEIDSFISFLSKDSDSVVNRKMEGAENAWQIAEDEIENFHQNPIAAYQAFAYSAEEIIKELNEPEPFQKPAGWIDIRIPRSNLILSMPGDWNQSIYGSENQFLELNNPDRTLKLTVGATQDLGLSDLDSDNGRLFSLQTVLETWGYDYYLEKSADIEVQGLNKAFVVQFSARLFSGSDIEDHIWSVVITPENDEIIVNADTTRDDFAQIDLLDFRLIIGSIRK